MSSSLFHTLDKLATDRWARRGVRALLRAAWLGVSIWCAGLGAHLVWGWPLRSNLLGAAALAVVGVGVALLLRPRLSARQAARRLDRRFHLDEQLATAVEVAASNPPPGSIAARLLAEAAHTSALIDRRLERRQRPPWHDLLTLALLGLVALGLAIVAGVGQPRLDAGTLPLPPLAEPQDPAAQLPQEPRADQPGSAGQPGAEETGAAQPQAAADPQIIRALADALRDQGVTRAAAQALDRGDTAGAARELRALADQASQLSQATRDALADSLRAAADTIAPRNRDLAEQLNQSAAGLERGDQAAAQALDDLARAIEQLPSAPRDVEQAGAQPEAGGQAPGSPGDAPPSAGQPGAGQPQSGSGAGSGPGGEQRPADTSGRLGVEGQPVPLESAGQGDIPADASGPLQPGAGRPQPGFTQGDASSSRQVDVGADPLRVPMDERDVVQEYFQP